MLPWFDPEITPNVSEPGARLYGMDWSDPAVAARAVVEGQMASLAVHSRWMDVRAETIYATGGASSNREILQILADTFGADVYPSNVGQTAALGAALRAWHAERQSAGEVIPWEDVVEGLADPVISERVSPRSELTSRYRQFQELYRACENHALNDGPDPAAVRDRFNAG